MLCARGEHESFDISNKSKSEYSLAVPVTREPNARTSACGRWTLRSRLMISRCWALTSITARLQVGKERLRVS